MRLLPSVYNQKHKERIEQNNFYVDLGIEAKPGKLLKFKHVGTICLQVVPLEIELVKVDVACPKLRVAVVDDDHVHKSDHDVEYDENDLCLVAFVLIVLKFLHRLKV